MTDRKIWKAVLCFAMSIVLAVPGCAANTPASELAQSDLQEAAQGGTGQEAAGQDSALQENTEQAAAGEEISEQKETSGDVFDFEEGDQSTPAAAGEMPSKFDLRDVEVKGSGIVPPVRFQNPFGTCWSFGTDIQQRLSICRKNTWLILPIVHWMTRRTRRMARESIFLSKHPARRR